VQAGRQARVAVVDAVAEDVQVLAELVHGRQLDRGHDADLVLGGGGQRLADPVDGVVVGEREHLHAGARGGRDDRARGQRPVGERGVRLQVEGGGRGGHLARHPKPRRVQEICG
jgi:hypothetical protein